MNTLSASSLIKNILSAKHAVEIFPNLGDWKTLYKEYIILIHPDKCSDPQAKDAVTVLNSFKDELENGKKIKDDAGVITYLPKSFELIGEDRLLDISYENFRKLMSFKDSASVHFQKYLPETATKLSDHEMKYTFFDRAIPSISVGSLPQEHVNWILSRMLEFSGWINQQGYCHAGINPDSVWIMPENHGMLCVSFYHMKKLGAKLSTVSGKYSQFYPANVFTDKMATSNIDIELCKKTAAFLLGDKSGTGTALRKTHNPDFVSFLQKRHDDPIQCYQEYREMLKNNFDTKKFIPLNI